MLCVSDELLQIAFGKRRVICVCMLTVRFRILTPELEV